MPRPMWNGFYLTTETHIFYRDLLSSFQRPIPRRIHRLSSSSALRAAERLVLLLFVFRPVNRLRFFIFDAGPVSEDPRLIGFRLSLEPLWISPLRVGASTPCFPFCQPFRSFFRSGPVSEGPRLIGLLGLSFGPRRPASSRDAAYRGSGFCRQLGSKKNSTQTRPPPNLLGSHVVFTAMTTPTRRLPRSSSSVTSPVPTNTCMTPELPRDN